MNTLLSPLIRVVLREGDPALLTLPGVFAALMADRIAAFPALRAHQRHAWHAFLVQLGAMALHAAGLTEPPTEEAAWCELLRALTPDDPADHAWSLVAPPDRPALLQPPIPDGLAALKNEITTPDALDMLVTAKNHDLKQAAMATAQPDDWLFALLTLQTMEGFLGAGNYGISRMNGGFANRAALGRVPPGGPGAQVRRDLRALLSLRAGIAERNGYPLTGGIGLVWLEPWDGSDSLPATRLDPLYIEVCRRVRAIERNGVLSARTGSSKEPRIEPAQGGVTGDPWAPLRVDKDRSLKALTLDASGFDYRRMV
jgi:CRISPR system Cascade subunit CasA